MSSPYPPSNALRVHGIRHDSDDTPDRTLPAPRSAPTLDIDLNSQYSPYSQPDSPSGEEDENASLRSQALNADGTPKRPMNAFMIFARRRRPQVSAANQMMRTGEISKILSKEWNTMPMSDKQFYLDQAKKLKENFNAKYPDYVYRRRPNNSRKKRRTDAAPYDPSVSPHDHDLSPEEYDSVSPIDGHHHHGHHHHGLAPNGESVSLASQGYRIPYSHASAAYPSHASDAGSSYPYYSHSHPHNSSHSHSSSRHLHYSPTSTLSPLSSLASSSYAAAPGIYHPDDDALPVWPAGTSSASAYPPVKLETHAWHDSAPTLRLSARRGTLNGGPPPLLAHARNWSDSTTGTSANSSASPPSSAGSGGFPASLGGSGAFAASGAGAGSFQTLTAPFYPGGSAGGSSGTVSPSTASASSASSGSYFSGPQAQTHAHSHSGASTHDRDSGYDSHSPTAYGSSHAHLAQPRAYSQSHSHSQPNSHAHAHSGATLGSTLALSPANVAHGSLWSSVRTKSEL